MDYNTIKELIYNDRRHAVGRRFNNSSTMTKGKIDSKLIGHQSDNYETLQSVFHVEEASKYFIMVCTTLNLLSFRM